MITGRRDALARMWWVYERVYLRARVARFADAERGARERATYYRERMAECVDHHERPAVVDHYRHLAEACDAKAAANALRLAGARLRLAQHMAWR
jgi:hypothetical protein